MVLLWLVIFLNKMQFCLRIAFWSRGFGVIVRVSKLATESIIFYFYQNSLFFFNNAGDTQKADCIRTLINEQRDLSMQAAGHSLFAMHLKQRLFIYHRYLIALSRLEITTMDKNALATRKSLLQTDQLKRNELKQQLIQVS